jgi:hypothetical protein
LVKEWSKSNESNIGVSVFTNVQFVRRFLLGSLRQLFRLVSLSLSAVWQPPYSFYGFGLNAGVK